MIILKPYVVNSIIEIFKIYCDVEFKRFYVQHYDIIETNLLQWEMP